jgi:hypothetical protein
VQTALGRPACVVVCYKPNFIADATRAPDVPLDSNYGRSALSSAGLGNPVHARACARNRPARLGILTWLSE